MVSYQFFCPFFLLFSLYLLRIGVKLEGGGKGSLPRQLSLRGQVLRKKLSEHGRINNVETGRVETSPQRFGVVVLGRCDVG